MSMVTGENYTLYHGDCLEWLPTLPDRCADVSIDDLPYGSTACPWDAVIPMDKLWMQFKRLVKPNGAIILFGSQPFTSSLVMSNPKWFRYELIWDKVNRYTNTLNANRMPLKRHENILIFYKHLPTYNKQYRKGKAFIAHMTKGHGKHTEYGHRADNRTTVNTGQHNPCSVLEIEGDVKTEIGLHPTQKPIALLEYLIRTYTNEGDTVLDVTMGSASTGEACINTGRKFIGIEKFPLSDRPTGKDNPDYFGLACRRMAEAESAPKQMQLIA